MSTASPNRCRNSSRNDAIFCVRPSFSAVAIVRPAGVKGVIRSSNVFGKLRLAAFIHTLSKNSYGVWPSSEIITNNLPALPTNRNRLSAAILTTSHPPESARA